MSATYAQRSVDVADEHGRVFKAWFLTSLPDEEVQWAAGLLLAAPADDLGLPLPDLDGVADLWRRAREELVL